MKIAVVTGVSKGIGYSITERLLENDFKVYGISRKSPDFNQNNFIWLQTDLLDRNEISSLKEKISENHIDILINNAGDFISQTGLEFDEENFEKQFGLNFKAPILVTQNLKEKLQNSLVINISSISDRIPGEECGLYCATKSALNSYFDCMALEENDIKVLSLLPSYVDTPLLRRLWGNEETPFNWDKIIKPENIADLVSRIINSSSKYDSGTRFIVVTDELKEDLEELEKVFVFNPDHNEIFKLK